MSDSKHIRWQIGMLDEPINMCALTPLHFLPMKETVGKSATCEACFLATKGYIEQHTSKVNPVALENLNTRIAALKYEKDITKVLT